MRIISVANQKGGCGKTTTAINLTFSLSLKGKKVLLIDCDPQSHATMGLNVKTSDLERNMYHVFTPKEEEQLRIEDILIPIKENFTLAPSSIILSAVEQELSGVEGREDRLLHALESLPHTYDYIIIDCPPSIGLLSFNALRASDELIIPIDMSLFSLHGVSKLMEIVILLKDRLGHDIKSRALVTMYDNRTRYSKRVLEKVKEEFGTNVFETVIRYNVRLRETVDYGLPVGDYDKHSIGHRDYESLSEEVISADTTRPEHCNTQDLTQDLLRTTESYIKTATQLPETDESHSSTGDASLHSLKSSYAEMVNALAAEPVASIVEDDET
jgi:chromosome partitioning protein